MEFFFLIFKTSISGSIVCSKAQSSHMLVGNPVSTNWNKSILPPKYLFCTTYYIVYIETFWGKEKNLSKSEPTNGFLIAFPSLRSFPQNRRRWKYHIQCVPYPSTYNVGLAVCSLGYVLRHVSTVVDQAVVAAAVGLWLLKKGIFLKGLKVLDFIGNTF